MRPVSRASIAWQGTLAAILLCIAGLPIELRIEKSVPGVPSWPILAMLGVALVLLGVMIALRRRLGVRGASIVFLVLNLAIVTMLWMTSFHFAASPRTWVPFQANKLGVLTAALLAPSGVVGAVTIALMGGSAILQFTTFGPELRMHLAIGEPWATIGFMLFAAVLLAYRVHQQRVMTELARSQSEAATLKGVARRLLALGDFANTPLQTIEASAALLHQVPGAMVHAERIERSLDRLREARAILTDVWKNAAWNEEAVSFDAAEVLKESSSPPR